MKSLQSGSLILAIEQFQAVKPSVVPKVLADVVDNVNDEKVNQSKNISVDETLAAISYCVQACLEQTP